MLDTQVVVAERGNLRIRWGRCRHEGLDRGTHCRWHPLGDVLVVLARRRQPLGQTLVLAGSECFACTEWSLVQAAQEAADDPPEVGKVEPRKLFA